MTDDERTQLETLRHTERALANFAAQHPPSLAVALEPLPAAPALPPSLAVALECCAECGGEIPDARRKALPGATLCVDCKRAEERRERIT